MSDKPFAPTAKKLRDARKRGEIPRSAQVVSTAVFGAVLLVLLLGMAPMLARLRALFDGLDLLLRERDNFKIALQFYQRSLGVLLWTVMPLLVAAIAAAMLAGGLQTRGLLSFEAIHAKLERLSPLSNLKRLVSLKQLLDLLKKILESIVLGLLVCAVIWRGAGQLLLGIYQPPAATAHTGAHMIYAMFSCAAIFWGAVSVMDYGIQYFTFMRDQRMSLEDIKRENKDMEGDPHVKGHRRAIQRDMTQQAPSARPLKGARAVIANPSHVCVALAFDRSDKAPRVHAKALDARALAMRTEAMQLGIPIFEDVPLARRLYRRVAVDQPVTPEFYAPVARVMVWIEELGLQDDEDSADQ